MYLVNFNVSKDACGKYHTRPDDFLHFKLMIAFLNVKYKTLVAKCYV